MIKELTIDVFEICLEIFIHMIYKRQKIIKKSVIIYEFPSNEEYKSAEISEISVKAIIHSKKYVFRRITDDIKFSCSGCILEGKCYRITIYNGTIKNYCREQDKFFGIKVYYKCCSEETIK